MKMMLTMAIALFILNFMVERDNGGASFVVVAHVFACGRRLSTFRVVINL
jgi:hypothetical protein